MAKDVLLQPDLPLASTSPKRRIWSLRLGDGMNDAWRAERSIVPQRASLSLFNMIAWTAEVGCIIAIR